MLSFGQCIGALTQEWQDEAMTIADQVLSYLKVLVWPAIIGTALIIFREPIKGILGNIEEFEGFGVKARIRSRVTQAVTASENALKTFPVTRRPGRTPALSYVVMQNMLRAQRFSFNLTYTDNIPVTDPLQRMRIAFKRLDTAIIAVLVATIFPDEADGKAAAPDTGGPAPERIHWQNPSPLGVEVYMEELTGYSGWRGVIESRDILGSLIVSICGKSAKALTAAEANSFESAVVNTLRRLSDLVYPVAFYPTGTPSAPPDTAAL